MATVRFILNIQRVFLFRSIRITTSIVSIDLKIKILYSVSKGEEESIATVPSVTKSAYEYDVT
jgi:hypothetical protein